MVYLGYSLEAAPDLSLAKYQALGDNDAGGVVGRHNAFLRQWNRITILAQARIHLIVQFCAKNQPRERMKFLFVLSTVRENMLQALDQLVKASPLADYFRLVPVKTEALSQQLAWDYSHEAILKKIERQRSSDTSTDANAASFFLVSGWTSAEDARLRDMLRVMDTLQENLAYVVSFEGVNAFDTVSHALERPIAYLRKKTSYGFSQSVSLDTTVKASSRDIAAEETLDEYEKFLTCVTESPCFYANVRAFSQTPTGAELLLAAAAGEAIEEGNAEISCLRQCEPLDDVLSAHRFFAKMVPESLRFWPTLFALEELSPFFRFPILLEGEQIDFPKETQAKHLSQGLPLGRDSFGYPVALDVDLLKKHAFVCGVPGAGKTNTMLGLCYNLWKEYRIPFLVLEPAKKEYRALAQTDIEDLVVFSPSAGSKFPLAINPFQFPKGMSLAEHIQNLDEVFEGAFPLVPPLPALLDRSIEAVYLDHGWDVEDINTGEREYPTMTELYQKLEEELEKTDYDGEVRGNMKSVLEMRISSLLRRDLGNVFDVPVSTIMPENWTKYPVIIELESLGKGPANFLTLMLCTLIRETLRADPKGDLGKPVRHVIFIEEAHNLIAPESSDTTGEDANPKSAATSYIVKMLAEVRALREGIVIADQLPTTMAPEILKNTTLKIAHRITSEDDRNLIGSTMAASGVQLEELSTYLPGETLAYYEGLLKPFKLRVNMFQAKDAPDTQQLFELMRAKPMHQKAMLFTVQSRLVKLQMQWVEEWKTATQIYDKLIADCNRLQDRAGDGNLKEALSEIMKDQLGMNSSLEVLKRLVKKHKDWVRDFENLPKDYTEFQDKAEKDIQAITYYVTKKLTDIKF